MFIMTERSFWMTILLGLDNSQATGLPAVPPEWMAGAEEGPKPSHAEPSLHCPIEHDTDGNWWHDCDRNDIS
jgi:hypothetical protein